MPKGPVIEEGVENTGKRAANVIQKELKLISKTAEDIVKHSKDYNEMR
jgi:hypothetical protein